MSTTPGFMKVFVPAAIAGLVFLALSKKASAAPAGAGPTPGPSPFPPTPPDGGSVFTTPPMTVTPTPTPAASLPQMVADDLNRALIAARGNVTAAKGTENKTLVAQFQSSEGLKPDGMYGPTTRQHLLKYVANAPPAMYFPKAKAG